MASYLYCRNRGRNTVGVTWLSRYKLSSSTCVPFALEKVVTKWPIALQEKSWSTSKFLLVPTLVFDIESANLNFLLIVQI